MSGTRAVADFFDSLPGNGLSPEERKVLRAIESLSDAVEELGLPAGVKLQEWAQKRVPPNAVDIVNASGVLYIPKSERPRTQPKPLQRSEETKKFMNSLPQEEFLKEEEMLRSRVCTVLLDNKLHVVEDVEQVPAVKRARDALLPPNVPLLDWIKERIGEEIALVHAEQGGLRIKLAPGFDKSSLEAGSSDDENSRTKSGSAWLESLPTQKLLPAELKLREAVLRLMKEDGSKPPSVSVVARDPEVRRHLDALKLPRDLTIADWIDHRIGGEVEVQEEKGRSSVLVAITDDQDDVNDDHEYQGGKEENIERFIEMAGVDEKAADSLRQAEPHVKAFVLSRGIEALRRGKNRSAKLRAWMRDARDRGASSRSVDRGRDPRDSSRGRGRSREGREMRDRHMESRVTDNPLLHRGAASAQSKAPVLKLSPGEHVKNRSRSPRNGRRSASPDKRRPLSYHRDSPTRGRGDSPVRGGRRSIERRDWHGGRGNSSWVPDQSHQFHRDKVERFIRENRLDSRAENALLECSAAIQQVVIDGGSLATAENPSAACLGRIRKARPLKN